MMVGFVTKSFLFGPRRGCKLKSNPEFPFLINNPNILVSSANVQLQMSYWAQNLRVEGAGRHVHGGNCFGMSITLAYRNKDMLRS